MSCLNVAVFLITSGLIACSGRSVERAGQGAGMVAKDTRISSEAQAEERMRSAPQRPLMDIRSGYNLPKTCR
jgi:hypothetical protein